MNKSVFTIVKVVAIAAIIGWVFFSNDSNDTEYAKDEIDLNLVLDVTVETLHTVSENTPEGTDADQAFIGLADALAVDYNKSQPAIYKSEIGVSPQVDASLLAFADDNKNKELDENEVALFKIEIDGENARIIASSRSGAVNDHHFSGTALIAGYLIGSMLTRQRAAGVSSKSLANKKTITSREAAKARAGSGSHSKGK
ncbi:hypothetical protein MHM98_16095 [Psychrobium sp. MM17-31]|uniref:hypothetical protein n=1 Tax=Psychrobium sp. MM17-31 TaxID=2917758 RepID=UPI001EF72C3C|nr:hypothetical protein [Psychrobium sp. MM17-31]MCG7532853.1 hypothetical protein [Psychrobium sp. MM17-31]